MTSNQIIEGLLQLGFNSGWVVLGEEITLWQHNVPQPTNAELLAASKLYAKALTDAQTVKDAARQTVLDKLGLTAHEAQALLG